MRTLVRLRQLHAGQRFTNTVCVLRVAILNATQNCSEALNTVVCKVTTTHRIRQRKGKWKARQTSMLRNRANRWQPADGDGHVPDMLWRFRRVPALNARLLVTLGVILYAALGGTYVIDEQQLSTDLMWWSFCSVLSAITVATLKLNFDRHDDREIVLAEHTLMLPLRNCFGRNMRRIPLSEIRSIELSRRSAGHVLCLNIADRLPVAIRSGDLELGELRALHDRIWSEALPLNSALLTARKLFDRQRLLPMSTLRIVALIAIVFAISISGRCERTDQLIAQGALNHWLVAHGEAFRIGAAALLHSGWLQLIVNCAALSVLGMRLEHVTGAWMFAGAFASGLLFGNLSACVWSEFPFVVGSSGGVFGLLALYLVTVVAQRKHLPTRTLFAPPLVMLAALLLTFVPLPGYAQSAHVGGFLGGLLWSVAAGQVSREARAVAALCVVAWFALLASTAYAVAGRDSWFIDVRPRIERPAPRRSRSTTER